MDASGQVIDTDQITGLSDTFGAPDQHLFIADDPSTTPIVDGSGITFTIDNAANSNDGDGNVNFFDANGPVDGSTPNDTPSYEEFESNRNNATAVSENAVTCFVSGTLIRTARGDVAVETLKVGDIAITACGAARPVRWLGHRALDCRKHPWQHEVQPVRIAAHAIAENVPARDLLVSPGHAICVDVVGEVLIPTLALVNGATIRQEAVDAVTYWHVELDSHDIILAENLPAESYIDVGNRHFFAEAELTALHAMPDAAPATTADYCRPFHPAGSRLAEVVRDQLRERAQMLGWRRDDADPLGVLGLEVDGARATRTREGMVARARLPATAQDVWLCSTSAVPGEILGGPDTRRLGLSLAALAIDDGLACRREVTCTDARLVDGFHGHEETHRWTDGRARLPAELWTGCRDSFMLCLSFCEHALPRWIAPAAVTDADMLTSKAA